VVTARSSGCRGSTRSAAAAGARSTTPSEGAARPRRVRELVHAGAERALHLNRPLARGRSRGARPRARYRRSPRARHPRRRGRPRRSSEHLDRGIAPAAREVARRPTARVVDVATPGRSRRRPTRTPSGTRRGTVSIGPRRSDERPLERRQSPRDRRAGRSAVRPATQVADRGHAARRARRRDRRARCGRAVGRRRHHDAGGWTTIATSSTPVDGVRRHAISPRPDRSERRA
jgi:hypothetical protein